MVLTKKINPGKVFDLTLPLSEVAEGYRARDERLAIKTRLRTDQPLSSSHDQFGTRYAPGKFPLPKPNTSCTCGLGCRNNAKREPLVLGDSWIQERHTDGESVSKAMEIRR